MEVIMKRQAPNSETAIDSTPKRLNAEILSSLLQCVANIDDTDDSPSHNIAEQLQISPKTLQDALLAQGLRLAD
jgi:hypothetical protein